MCIDILLSTTTCQAFPTHKTKKYVVQFDQYALTLAFPYLKNFDFFKWFKGFFFHFTNLAINNYFKTKN